MDSGYSPNQLLSFNEQSLSELRSRNCPSKKSIVIIIITARGFQGLHLLSERVEPTTNNFLVPCFIPCSSKIIICTLYSRHASIPNTSILVGAEHSFASNCNWKYWHSIQPRSLPQTARPYVMAKYLLPLATAAASLIAAVTDAVPTAGNTNFMRRDSPVGGPLPLPFPVSDFTSSVASVQNTYCAGDNVPGLQFGDQTLLYTTGDAVTTVRVNVYHSESLGIVVAHMGTNLSAILSVLADVDAIPVPPNPALGLSDSVFLFQGFQNSWETSWDALKTLLYKAREAYPTLPFFLTGHSQGASDCMLSAMAIAKEFGPDSISKIITYGPPRLGNPAFADAFDAYFKGKYTGVTNGNDWVSEVPTPAMGYRHPSGMVWIYPANSTNWSFYPDQEDMNGINSRFPELIDPATGQLYWGDHQGIYMHSSMGTEQVSAE